MQYFISVILSLGTGVEERLGLPRNAPVASRSTGINVGLEVPRWRGFLCCGLDRADD